MVIRVVNIIHSSIENSGAFLADNQVIVYILDNPRQSNNLKE